MAGEPKQFAIYKDAAGEWRWRLYAANVKLIANGGEGYKNKTDCIHGLRLVAAMASNADIWNVDTQSWE